MFPNSRFLFLSAAVSLSAAAAFGQNVISAKSGLVHYVEGDVTVDGTPVSGKPGTFADVKKDGSLTTTLGRAEVLLTPGVFLRVGEKSSIKMLDTKLASTRVEMLSGESILESDTPMKDNFVAMVYKDYEIVPVKHGLYGVTTSPAQLKVYAGEATVTAGGQAVTVREGHILNFTAALAQERFDPREGDSLYRWSKLRSEYISVANVSAAKSSEGMYSGYAPVGGGSWFFNPFYNMYTYLPYSGTAYSPFGYAFWSPFTVYQAFYPVYYNGGSSKSSGSTSTATSNSVPLSSVASRSSLGFGSSGGVVHGGSGAAGHGK
jgi:hypothetical protein